MGVRLEAGAVERAGAGACLVVLKSERELPVDSAELLGRAGQERPEHRNIEGTAAIAQQIFILPQDRVPRQREGKSPRSALPTHRGNEPFQPER